MKQRSLFFIFYRGSQIFNILIYLQFMKDSYTTSDVRAINAYTNKIILTDRQVFGKIYRDDVVLVIEENFNRQLNKIFGIGGFKKWWRRIKEGNVIRGFLDWKFRVGTRDELADPVIPRNNKLQKHDKWWRAVTNIPIIKLCYAHLSQTRIAIGNKITGFCCYPGREIFLEKFNEEFVAKQFTNQNELDDYLMNSNKMFFLLISIRPGLHSIAKRKLFTKNCLQII